MGALPPSSPRESGESAEALPYHPLTSVRRDFEVSDDGTVYENDDGKLEMDPEMEQVMAHYRKSVKPGTLLSLGCGPTHAHYMAAVEEKVSHITGLDIEPSNIQATREFFDAARSGKTEGELVEADDLAALRATAESLKNHGGYGRKSTDKRLKSMVEKHALPEGGHDLVVGDMHNLDSAIGDRKFDNILLSFSIFVPKDKQDNPRSALVQMFKNIRGHLNPGGRLTICDLPDFTNDDLAGDYREGDVVMENFYCDENAVRRGFLRQVLAEAGFTNVEVREQTKKEAKANEFEFRYVFAGADSPRGQGAVEETRSSVRRRAKKTAGQ